MSKDTSRSDTAQTAGAPRAMQLEGMARIIDFLLRSIREEKSISPDVADRLAKRIAGRIKRVVVWNVRNDAPPPELANAKAQAAVGNLRSTSSHPPAATQSAAVHETRTPSPAPAADAATTSSSAAAPFDPYAFSVVVVLTKAGKDGLLKKLAGIERPEHLRKLAEAQHLAVDAGLSSVADLRTAIVKAAEQRIANRRAAAS